MNDYDNADPLAGSGLTADDYGEESFAGPETPWTDPDEEARSEELSGGEGGTTGKRQGEASYGERSERQTADSEATPAEDGDYYAVARRNRRLQDAQSYRVGLNLDRGGGGLDVWELPDDEKQPIECLYTEPSKPREPRLPQLPSRELLDWLVNIPEDDPFLDEPFPWESKVREARERANLLPLGMSPAWYRLREIVETEWALQRPTSAMVNGHGYDEYELSEPEFDAMTGVIQELRKDGWGGDETAAEQLSGKVRLAQGTLFGVETRGGPRKRGPARRAKRVYPDDCLDAPFYHYDFTTAAKGRGKGWRDELAMADWLTGSLVVNHGRRWLSRTGNPEFKLEDWRALRRPAANGELATRVRELKRDGACTKNLAEVLNKSVDTIKRMVK